MRGFRSAAVLALLFCAQILAAEPRVRQLPPPATVSLGQPVYWILEARHPLWESCTLTLQAPQGATMELQDTLYRRQGDDIITLYRIRIAASGLTIQGPPMALLTGADGKPVVVRGPEMKVASISGESLEVRDPAVPRFAVAPSSTLRAAGWIAVAALLLVLAGMWIQRRRAATPRQVLLRHLREAAARAASRKPPDPAWLCTLFRSELLWGEPVEAATVAELVERAAQTRQHRVLTEALEMLEQARYSGARVGDGSVIVRSVDAAREILQKS